MYLKSSQCNFSHPSKPEKYLTHSQWEISALDFLPSTQKGLQACTVCVIGSPTTLALREYMNLLQDFWNFSMKFPDSSLF